MISPLMYLIRRDLISSSLHSVFSFLFSSSVIVVNNFDEKMLVQRFLHCNSKA